MLDAIGAGGTGETLARFMTTLIDFLPRIPALQLNGFQRALGMAFLIIVLSWGVVSTIVVLANGSYLFSDDPECTTFLKLTRKYSPPFWRKIAFRAARLEIVLLVLFLLSLIIWHEKRLG